MNVGIPRWFAGFAVLMVAAVVAVAAVGEVAEHLDDRPLPADDDEDLVLMADELVDRLEVAPETNHDTYVREAFGSGWRVEDGCDTRARVLIYQSLVEPDVSGDCNVTRGEWDSWFDGVTLTDPAGIDIDHVVPLAEAWASGADGWSDGQRLEFANDTSGLVAATAKVNRSKSDQDPSEWMPPADDAHCRYTAAWVTHKHAWGLTADPAEHQQLAAVLDDCSRNIDSPHQEETNGQ